jgi:hypothetical protein
VHDLAREPLAPQLVVELQVERHRVRALALELVALERLQREREVLGAELVVVALDADRHSAAVPQRGRDVGGIERRDGRRDLRHLLAEARAEQAIVRLDVV